MGRALRLDSFLLAGGNDVQQIKGAYAVQVHKALWSKDFDGLPSNEFFNSLDPLLNGFTEKLFKETYTSDLPVGNLSETWAQRLGLSTDVLIGSRSF
jgi:L-ribulokinase